MFFFHMTDRDIDEEILKDMGGISQNDLNEIRRIVTDTDLKGHTFDDSAMTEIDSMTDNFNTLLWVWKKQFRVYWVLLIYLKEECTYNYRKLNHQFNLWQGIFIDIFNEHISKKLQ